MTWDLRFTGGAGAVLLWREKTFFEVVLGQRLLFPALHWIRAISVICGSLDEPRIGRIVRIGGQGEAVCGWVGFLGNAGVYTHLFGR